MESYGASAWDDDSAIWCLHSKISLSLSCLLLIIHDAAHNCLSDLRPFPSAWLLRLKSISLNIYSSSCGINSVVITLLIACLFMSLDWLDLCGFVEVRVLIRETLLWNVNTTDILARFSSSYLVWWLKPTLSNQWALKYMRRFAIRQLSYIVDFNITSTTTKIERFCYSDKMIFDKKRI